MINVIFEKYKYLLGLFSAQEDLSLLSAEQLDQQIRGGSRKSKVFEMAFSAF
jgi:hypothetical protein